MPQCGIGASGSNSAACRNDRSASVAQKECNCATPWSKNSCAFGFEVVIGKWTWPWPLMIFAGREGATPLGGGTHMSGCFDCAKAETVAMNKTVAVFIFDNRIASLEWEVERNPRRTEWN